MCGVSASRARNSSISRDLPRPGSPTISESCPSPRRARSQRRVEDVEFLAAADQRRRRARAAASPAAAGPHDAVELHLCGHALQLVLTLVLGDEEPGDLAMHAQRDPYFSGRGGALHARGDVGRFAVHLARRIDHDPPALQPDARGKLRRASRGVACVEVGERALDRERRAHGALAVVLLRLGIAEQRHQPVAELLQDMAAERGHGGRGGVEITPHQIPPVLGIELRREARRAHEVAKHDRDRTVLGVLAGRRGWRRGLRRWWFGGQRRGRREQLAPMPQRSDADFLQVRVGERRRDSEVDVVVGERLGVLPKIEPLQPIGDAHCATSVPGRRDGVSPPVSPSRAYCKIATCDSLLPNDGYGSICDGRSGFPILQHEIHPVTSAKGERAVSLGFAAVNHAWCHVKRRSGDRLYYRQALSIIILSGPGIHSFLISLSMPTAPNRETPYLLARPHRYRSPV